MSVAVENIRTPFGTLPSTCRPLPYYLSWCQAAYNSSHQPSAWYCLKDPRVANNLVEIENRGSGASFTITVSHGDIFHPHATIWPYDTALSRSAAADTGSADTAQLLQLVGPASGELTVLANGRWTLFDGMRGLARRESLHSCPAYLSGCSVANLIPGQRYFLEVDTGNTTPRPDWRAEIYDRRFGVLRVPVSIGADPITSTVAVVSSYTFTSAAAGNYTITLNASSTELEFDLYMTDPLTYVGNCQPNGTTTSCTLALAAGQPYRLEVHGGATIFDLQVAEAQP